MRADLRVILRQLTEGPGVYPQTKGALSQCSPTYRSPQGASAYLSWAAVCPPGGKSACLLSATYQPWGNKKSILGSDPFSSHHESLSPLAPSQAGVGTGGPHKFHSESALWLALTFLVTML